jgi:H+-transporting ATPase
MSMKPNTNQLKVLELKPGAKPDAKDDLKSMPLPEVVKKLGSSPDGLSQAEARETADPIRAERAGRKEDQSRS